MSDRQDHRYDGDDDDRFDLDDDFDDEFDDDLDDDRDDRDRADGDRIDDDRSDRDRADNDPSDNDRADNDRADNDRADNDRAGDDRGGNGRGGGETAVAWKRIKRAFGWRVTRAQVAGGALLAIVGFAATVQVQALRADDEYSTASRTQLVQYLDTLQQHSRRLDQDINALEEARRDLSSGADRSKAAIEQAKQRETTFGILAGALPARGPGIRLKIPATSDRVGATLIINAVEELRDAGAESIEINDRVRIVAGSYVLDTPDGLKVDGTLLGPAYTIDAIGEPDALAKAMTIPGGIDDEVNGQAKIEQRKNVRIDSLHRATQREFAEPVPPGEGGGDK